MKNFATSQQWLTIGLIIVGTLSLFPDLSNAGCPYARRVRKTCPFQKQIQKGSESRIINVATLTKRCPQGQHLFKGNCINNTILDNFEVCTETNCTENCPNCRNKTVSCFPRPDNKDVYICIECKSNKNCRKGYICDNYRCIPQTDNMSPTVLDGSADKSKSH